ncbi:MAG: hypothetical protein DI548_02880 [Flavobacterium johnsoniae]|nr:MAG: hypothetical protein DI548_02880 [Flavobacterium johnsoniae]
MFRVTSITQAALQLGRFSAYALSQLIILLNWGNYQTLNWISLISLFFSLPFALLLPMISWKQAYLKKLEARDEKKTEEELSQVTYKTFAKMHFLNLYHDFKRIYSDFFIAKWSLWWAFASCVFYQVWLERQLLIIYSDWELHTDSMGYCY